MIDMKIIKIMPADTRFIDSPDAGLPECRCSRCGKVIEEKEVPIRVWPGDKHTEYRYHLQCIFPGSQVSDDSEEAFYFDPEEVL